MVLLAPNIRGIAFHWQLFASYKKWRRQQASIFECVACPLLDSHKLGELEGAIQFGSKVHQAFDSDRNFLSQQPQHETQQQGQQEAWILGSFAYDFNRFSDSRLKTALVVGIDLGIGDPVTPAASQVQTSYTIGEGPEKSGLWRKILQKISVIMTIKPGTGKPYNLMQGRLKEASIGKFKPMDQFDWRWPEQIDKARIEQIMIQNHPSSCVQMYSEQEHFSAFVTGGTFSEKLT